MGNVATDENGIEGAIEMNGECPARIVNARLEDLVR